MPWPVSSMPLPVDARRGPRARRLGRRSASSMTNEVAGLSLNAAGLTMGHRCSLFTVAPCQNEAGMGRIYDCQVCRPDSPTACGLSVWAGWLRGRMDWSRLGSWSVLFVLGGIAGLLNPGPRKRQTCLKCRDRTYLFIPQSVTNLVPVKGHVA